MKLAIVCLAVVAAALAKPSPAEDLYTTKYDNVDLDSILKNDRLLRNYTGCLLEKGGCTDDAKLLKKILPEALTNECKKCSAKQKEGAEKVIRYLMQNKKELFEELQKKYDPKKIYMKKYEQKLSAKA